MKPRPRRPAAAAASCSPLRAFGFTIVWTVCFYVLLTYMPTWTQKYIKLSRVRGAVVEHASACWC